MPFDDALPAGLPALPRLSARSLPLLRALLVAYALVSAGGCPRGAGELDVETLPLVTTDDPQAEADLRAARESADAGRAQEAAQRYERFLEVHPVDPLAPIAELGLGQILLAEGDNAGALVRFQRVAGNTDPATAERGRFYEGVALQLGGHSRDALTRLRPLIGRTVDPAETALLLRTVAAASEQLGERIPAIEALDALMREPVPEEERATARQHLEALASSSLTAEEATRAEETLPHDGAAWAPVARRALRDAFTAGDMPRVRTLGASLQAANVVLDEELASMLLRASRPADVAPGVVGAILPLSGRGREVGQRALRGLMLAAGIPSNGPPAPGAPQLVFRDTGGDPARAAAAVDELVQLHRVIAIIGAIGNDEAAAAAARAQALGVPLLTLSTASDVTSVGPMIFRAFSTPDAELDALVARARAGGALRFAVLAPTNGFGDAMRASLTRAVTARGGQLVATQSYAPGATSFGREAAALRTAAPDALFVADAARALALIAPALAAAGLVAQPAGAPAPREGKAFVLLAPGLAFDPSLTRSSGRYLQGALFAVPFHAATATGAGRVFADTYAQQLGGEPDTFAAFAYDAYRLVRSAVDGGARTRPALAARLAGVTADTASAAGGFTATREPRRATRLLELRGTAFGAVE
jgi:ABC-type branched-subunit amino acid transport system substrate-binding protein